MRKTTGDLSRELLEQPYIEDYLKENQESFLENEVAESLSAMFKRCTMSKAALARLAGMSDVYLHQVFSKRRKPSRDRLICLCIGMGASLDEIQNLLRQAGYGLLYPKVRRDAIISHGILHGADLSEINDRLFAEEEKTLF